MQRLHSFLEIQGTIYPFCIFPDCRAARSHASRFVSTAARTERIKIGGALHNCTEKKNLIQVSFPFFYIYPMLF